MQLHETGPDRPAMGRGGAGWWVFSMRFDAHGGTLKKYAAGQFC